MDKTVDKKMDNKMDNKIDKTHGGIVAFNETHNN